MSRRRGPRTGGEDTRQQILEAARRLFAQHGYDRTTMRAIGAASRVDPSLIHHYFGKKENLFAASISLPVDLPRRLSEILGESSTVAGEALARMFFSVWEDADARTALIGQLRHAITTGERPVVAEFITSAVLGRVAAVMEGEDRELRAELVASHLMGIALLRYIIRMEPLASAEVETIVAMVAPRLQQYLDGTRSDPGS
ncbi:MAG: TetR family transcriptional regulator [Acidimicrobiia bacterium]|nr:TetR family transcriptional regulator [Acidimicrobiia bacterium]